MRHQSRDRVSGYSGPDAAIEQMVSHRASRLCLPVVRDGRLVGIISERDLIAVTRDYLLGRLGESP